MGCKPSTKRLTRSRSTMRASTNVTGPRGGSTFSTEHVNVDDNERPHSKKEAPTSMLPAYPDYEERRRSTLSQPSTDDIDVKIPISASTCQRKENEPDDQAEGGGAVSTAARASVSKSISADRTRKARGSSQGSSSSVISTELILAAFSARSRRRSTLDTVSVNKTIDLSDSQKEEMVKVWTKCIGDRPKQAVTFGVLFLRLFLISPETKAVFPILEKLKLHKICSASHVRQTLDTINIAVFNMDNLASTLRVFRKTGARHIKYGVDSAEIVECFMAGVLHMLCKVLDQNNPSLTKAWESILDLIKAEFLLGIKRGMVSYSSVDLSFESTAEIDSAFRSSVCRLPEIKDDGDDEGGSVHDVS